MTDADEGLKKLMDEDYAREVILGDGGVEVFLKGCRSSTTPSLDYGMNTIP